MARPETPQPPYERRSPAATSNRIRQWIETHTFHHSRFADIAALVKRKQDLGVSISLCIPTLNEEKTIGKEVVLFRSELMQRYPLLDELAIIDSGSTDRTMDVAAHFGADVYRAADILPELGHVAGKGENLWKAIYQLRGDIIVYCDADIKNIHPRFAYGLIGPLLYDPDVQYVKAFYTRPLIRDRQVIPAGGGRVTEILVRPLFAHFAPELSAIIQPLSGEYAVRRGALERLSFPIGYGVETAHLLDVYRLWGLDALAQVDLDERIHRNQATLDLGRMAFGILQAFLPRVRPANHPLPPESILRQFQLSEAGYEPVEHRIQGVERPPMITVPAYQKKYGRSAQTSCE